MRRAELLALLVAVYMAHCTWAMDVEKVMRLYPNGTLVDPALAPNSTQAITIRSWQLPFHFNTPHFVIGNSSFTLRAPLVWATPPSGCRSALQPQCLVLAVQFFRVPNSHGKIVFVRESLEGDSRKTFCSIETRIRRCQDAGCLAIVSTAKLLPDGIVAWSVFDLTAKDDLRAPMVEVYKRDFPRMESMLNTLRNFNAQPQPSNSQLVLVVSIRSGEPNAWHDTVSTPLVFFLIDFMWVFLPALCTALGIYVLVRWYAVLRRMRVPRSNTIILCSVLELIANILRLIPSSIDPLFTKHRIALAPERILLTITGPIGFAITLMIAFVWAAALDSAGLSNRAINFMGSKMGRYACAFMILLVFGTDLAVSTLEITFYPQGPVIFVASILYVLIQLAVGVMFLLTGYTVTRQLQAALGHLDARSESKLTARVHNMSRWLFTCGAFMLGFCVAVSFVGSKYMSEIWGFIIIWVSINYCVHAVSATQLVSFISHIPAEDVVAAASQPLSEGEGPEAGLSQHDEGDDAGAGAALLANEKVDKNKLSVNSGGGGRADDSASAPFLSGPRRPTRGPGSFQMPLTANSRGHSRGGSGGGSQGGGGGGGSGPPSRENSFDIGR